MDHERMPPQDLDSEQALLGSCLIDAGALDRVCDMVAAEDFYREAHRLIWGALIVVRESGAPVDLVTVAGELRRRGQLEGCGGGEYLTALIAEVPTTAHAPQYAHNVVKLSVSRQAISLGSQVMAGGYDNPEQPADLIGDAIHRLERLQERAAPATRPVLSAVSFEEDWHQIERRMSRPYAVSQEQFGIPDVDQDTGGLEDCGFGLILGDTNAGKSSLLRQIALSSALSVDEGVIVVFALEEDRWRWMRRSLGWIGSFDTRALRNQPFWEAELTKTPDLMVRLNAAIAALTNLPLVVCGGDLSIGQIESVCRNLQRQHRVRMVCIDYAQKIGKPDMQNEEQAFREVAQRLARLRDNLGSIPVIAPSQITDTGGDRRPMHARAFAHEADTVMDIARKRTEDGKWEEQALLAISKSRELDAGRWPLWTDFKTGRWSGVDETRGVRAA